MSRIFSSIPFCARFPQCMRIEGLATRYEMHGMSGDFVPMLTRCDGWQSLVQPEEKEK
jgi:hypothetical protein